MFGSTVLVSGPTDIFLKAHAGRYVATNSGLLILVSDILCVWCVMFCFGLLLSEYPVLCMQVVCGGIMSDPDVYIYIC